MRPKKIGAARWRPLVSFGGEEEDRTPDLRIANATLSQLSYPPTEEAETVAQRLRGPGGRIAACYPNHCEPLLVAGVRLE